MANKQIVSPLPGTFYRQSAPDKPPFKAEGDVVAVGETIGLVEVMKSFQEIQAKVEGRIIRFLIDNEEPVMAGQPIAEVES
jgi:acetyl-CoA carboxylase biotin carboxyl carrier protein